jgi:hypothetical protein
MSDTLCVLALDATDYALAKQWDCTNILQSDHRKLEVFAHTFDLPYTPEVWTTAATGQDPTEHDVAGDVRKWNNPTLRFASSLTSRLPSGLRELLGKPFRSAGAKRSFRETSVDHAFDMVYGWPGITPAENLHEAWNWYSQAEAGELTASQLDRNLRANTGEEFGWLAAVSRADCNLVGVHSQVLDVASHVFCQREDKLRETYMWVDELVGWLREYVNRLVILSDHGMQTVVTDDEEPGRHSWRAMISTQGVDADLPESVFDVREWLEDNSGTAVDGEDESVEVDTPMDRLSNLGYLDG